MSSKLFGEKQMKVKMLFLFYSIFFLLVILTACDRKTVPKDDYEQLKAECKRDYLKLKADYNQLNTRYQNALEKLHSLEMVNRSELLARMEEMENTQKESNKRAFVQGQFDLLKNIKVVGTSSEDGWIFKDYFYTFRLYVYDREIYQMHVETEDKVTPTAQILGAIADISGIINLRNQ